MLINYNFQSITIKFLVLFCYKIGMNIMNQITEKMQKMEVNNFSKFI